MQQSGAAPALPSGGGASSDAESLLTLRVERTSRRWRGALRRALVAGDGAAAAALQNALSQVRRAALLFVLI